MELIDEEYLLPSMASYKRFIEKFESALKRGQFYEKSIGRDFNYPYS